MQIEARTPANPSGGTDGYVALPDARAESFASEVAATLKKRSEAG